MMRRLLAFMDRAGLGDIDDGVEEAGFDFRSPPGKFDADLDALLFQEYFLVKPTSSVAMTPPLSCSGFWTGRLIGDAKHPAGRAAGGFGIDKFKDFANVGAGFPGSSRNP